jgi:hypothetical protein
VVVLHPVGVVHLVPVLLLVVVLLPVVVVVPNKEDLAPMYPLSTPAAALVLALNKVASPGRWLSRPHLNKAEPLKFLRICLVLPAAAPALALNKVEPLRISRLGRLQAAAPALVPGLNKAASLLSLPQ